MNDLQFTAELKGTDIYIYRLNRYLGVTDCDIETEITATVKFHVEIEAREWGVKGIDIFVDSVTVYVNWEAYIEDITAEEITALLKAGGVYLNETIVGTIEINTGGEKGGKWEVKNEMEARCTITPNDIEVDFEKMIITVTN